MLQLAIAPRLITVITIVTHLLLLIHGKKVFAKNGFCDTIGGQSNIILDIEESRGNSTNQQTIPEELPINGEPDKEIRIELNFKDGRKLFYLDGKQLRLLEPIDRDLELKSFVIFEISCMVLSHKKKRNIPVIVRITDINDNAPEFLNTPYETTISELTPIGTIIYRNIYAKDNDAGLNERVEYRIVPSNRSSFERVTIADGFGYFAINLSHEGQVVVNSALDFEKTQQYLVTIVASDRARNVNERFSSTATLTVNIEDADDQDPTFVYRGCMIFEGGCINPEYTATVLSGKLNGILNIHPEKIQAIDMDSLKSPIKYIFENFNPSNYSEYFEINAINAEITQKKVLETSTIKQFAVTIKAEEITNNSRSALAKLIIVVKPVDSNPPILHVSATHGYVNENSEIGTEVLDDKNNSIKFFVTDDDFEPNDPRPSYLFELTTDLFHVDDNGVLVVNSNHLDRDPPNSETLKFQIIVKEVNGSAVSPPLALSVTLNDVNDNAPILPTFSPISIKAGDEKREIIKINAVDKDKGRNAIVKYGIHHISNNGIKKFQIDESSGLLEAIGKLNVGDHYSITVEARDLDGFKNQAIVEVFVKPGPNKRSPVFTKYIYDVQISEGVAVNTAVATVTAKDPEDDAIKYSLVYGDDLRQFSIDSSTGVISVIRKLDREDLTRYQLVILAEDAGRLSSSATVNVIVTDINDKNPEFTNLPYHFAVEEGHVNQAVGKVHAADLDDGINAEVSYFVQKDVPFTIDEKNGDISTTIALDYETQSLYKVVVTAQDGGIEPRIATCTVTVQVIDLEDELPTFPKTLYEVTIAENLPQFPVAKISAIDSDSIKRITYELRQGPDDLFQIDEKTGEIFTTSKGLDYEIENIHVLLIGTKENIGTKNGDFAKVIVKVEDRNDIVPMFTQLPRPVTVDDESEIGTKVFSVHAIDNDGTSPGNVVKYELIGNEKTLKYFQIDPDSGVVLVKGNLKNDADNEYEIDIKAYDLGKPQLYSIATLHVFVRHIATVAPEVGLGFSDDSYTIQLFENATKDSLIKIIKIVNNYMHNVPLKCYIISGNNEGKFLINTTNDRNCALYLNGTLDYETSEDYSIDLQIDSLQGFVNPQKSTAILKVNVVDVNDNKPYFIYPEDRREKNGQTKFYAVVPWDAEISAIVIQIKAEDLDSGRYSKLEYRLLGDKKSLQYFIIDRNSGIVKIQKTFNDISENDLPFELVVQVNDNPNSTSSSNYIEALLVINLISEENRMILVIGDASPDKILGEKDSIINIIQDHSNLLVGIEKITSRLYFSENNSLEMDSLGSDVWFYVIDPLTEKIFKRNYSRVQRSILSRNSMDKILFDITGTVKHTAFNIHEPLFVQKTNTITAAASYSYDLFPYAAISIGCVMFFICLAGIVYLYISWSRYKTVKDQSQQSNYSSTLMSNHIRPCLQNDSNFIEPTLKEYETQILQMSVNVDDNDSHNDLQLDFSNKSHMFNFDKVGYISKEQDGYNRSMVANTATLKKITNGTLQKAAAGVCIENNGGTAVATINPLYQKSFHEESTNRSTSNENVVFKEKKDVLLEKPNTLTSYSYVETTTEL